MISKADWLSLYRLMAWEEDNRSIYYLAKMFYESRLDDYYWLPNVPLSTAQSFITYFGSEWP